MKPIQISLALSAVLGGLIAALPAQADITKGVWSRDDGQARVRISKCGAALCVTNVWIKSPGNEKVGDLLVMNVEPTQAGVMSGTAYDLQRKLNYKITVKEFGDRMTSSGCVLGGLLCKTESWSRWVPDNIGPESSSQPPPAHCRVVHCSSARSFSAAFRHWG